MKHFFPILFVLNLSCAPSDTQSNDSELIQVSRHGIEEGQYEEICRIQAELNPDYELLSMVRAKSFLWSKHDGVELTTHLIFNEFHCGFIKEEGARRCLKYTLADITPGGTFGFCVDRNGEVTDFFAEE